VFGTEDEILDEQFEDHIAQWAGQSSKRARSKMRPCSHFPDFCFLQTVRASLFNEQPMH